MSVTQESLVNLKEKGVGSGAVAGLAQPAAGSPIRQDGFIFHMQICEGDIELVSGQRFGEPDLRPT